MTGGGENNHGFVLGEDGRDFKEAEAEEIPVEPVSFLQLFRYASRYERLQVFASVVLALATGACVPFFNVLYSEFTGLLAERSTAFATSSPCRLLNLFGGCQKLVNATYDVRMEALEADAVAFAVGCVGSGLVQFVLAALAVSLVSQAALGQTCRVRALFLQALLRQEQAWHQCGAANVATSLADDIDKLADGLGEALAVLVFLSVSFVGSIVVALVAGWELTLIVMLGAPVIIISQAVLAKAQSSLAAQESAAHAKAGAVAEETLGALRTVIAFGGEDDAQDRYALALAPATAAAERRGWSAGAAGGVMWAAIYCSYSLAFWFGVRLVLDADGGGRYSPAVIVIVLFSMLTGAMNLGQATPHLEAVNVARGAAGRVFAAMQRRSPIDALAAEGATPPAVGGDVEMRGVTFRFPSRPGVQVLTDFNLRIRRGQTVALVGESGSGKSTALQLVQRFYDPGEGTVSIDGMDVRELNVGWLRTQVGVVSQEAALFAGSVRDNIRFGAPDATEEDVLQAARLAHADEFITALPQGYDTVVGERGGQLSGGQRQRVAIARALVRRPAILLLDEATSALDRRSEAQVQAALDNASRGRTTLVVAHRLATVRDADEIVVLAGGQVVQRGSHAQLAADADGPYAALLAADAATAAGRSADGAANEEPTRNQSAGEGKSEPDVDGSKTVSDKEGVEQEGDDEEKEVSAPMLRVLALSRPELRLVAAGCVAAVVVGCSLPAFAVLFGGLFSVFSLENADDVRSQTAIYSLYFLALGLGTGAGTFVLTWSLSVAGARLTARLRTSALRALLRQEAAWFDAPRNSVAALASRLATDAASVQGATGSRVAVLLQAVATLAVGFAVAATYSWQTALVSACVVPVLLAVLLAESRVTGAHGAAERRALQRAAAVALEAVGNAQAVASLAAERAVIRRYESELRKALRFGRRRASLRGVVFALGQAVPFMCYSLSFWYGATRVARYAMPYFHVIIVAEALVFGGKMLGRALAFAPKLAAARQAAARMLALEDRQPAMTAPEGDVDEKTLDGDLRMTGVDFRYPSRRAACALRGLDLRALRGRTVALVGESGSGKSTALQLLQRLYDVDAGSVSVGDVDVRSLPLRQLRRRVGVVSQEPALLARSLAENIAYGDNARVVPMDEVVAAARQAHAHEFIVAMPLGYDTVVGERGGQLSGGQRQRVAIARALVRRPAILLLDEATSALDRRSEAAVQAALSAAREGRTCVTVAHRAAAAAAADWVFVLHEGAVVEAGTHEQLLQRNGRYARLRERNAQQRE